MARGEASRSRGRGWSGPHATATDERKKWKVSDSTGEKREASETTSKWFPSTICGDHLEAHVMEKSLSSKEELPWMMARTEAILALVGDERVLHQQLFGHILGFPLHSFVHELLFFYACQLHHLTPNTVLHIANFIMLRDCFLGMELHFELFHYYFWVKVQKSGNDVCDLGGTNLQLPPSSNYFKVALPKSVRDWHKGWFYVSGLVEDPPTFVNVLPKRQRSSKPVKKLSDDTKKMVDAILGLWDCGLKREHILLTWLDRRVSLAARAH